ncbi:MAG TPA: HAMP domain-containing sensor histidine kinase [Pseudonocardiaceae bacterium]|jgi:signal transduction histidine kinase|nr:HAMP domain-containing sensor histidine kinase [Pseudonocardiaceae bacterium]
MTAPARPAQLHTASLRRRVTGWVLAVLLVVLITVVGLVSILFAVASNRDTTVLLNDRAQLAAQLGRQGVGARQLVNRVDVGGVRARLVLVDGESFGSLSKRDASGKARTLTLSAAHGQLNGARLTLQADNTVLTAAQARLRRLLILTGLGALAVTAVLLVVIVRLALAPLDSMTTLARSIAGGDRGRRLWPTRTDTELGRTAAAFDDMLDALEGAETQARAAESVSRQAEAAARAAAERTKRFVADAAHELRTPIAGVAAVAEAVLQQPPDADPEERQRLHLLLVRESHRAGQLVDDLLDLARIDAGIELDLGPVALRPLAEGQAERLRLLAPELTVEVTGPELSTPGDAGRITQILANLLDNARQAGEAAGRITVRLATAGRFAEVVVADTGPGVPPADQERIFDRLVRLDQARDRRSGGSGLGLAIARGFARAHGGELTCEPVPAGEPGAVFRLLLPMAPPPEPPTQPLPKLD